MANPDQDDAAANRGYVLSQVSSKADKSELTTKADKSDLIQRADKSEPVQKADITYVDTELTKKADLSIINSELAIKTDLSAVLVIDGSNPIIGDLDMGATVSFNLYEPNENDSKHATNVNFVKKYIADKLKHNITNVAMQNDLLYLMGPNDEFSDEDDVQDKPFENKDFHKFNKVTKPLISS